ncbi:DUF3800 domain-containing protein [Candidatus Saccharibacteria bacterium]|nr:DUF3800 domain-containing protein [Candidatus Saccharibacteria bacterium]
MDDEGLKMKKLVFIDESGNPGIKNEQGEFVMIAVVILSEEEYLKLDSYMDGFKRGINWSSDAEFKFVKTRKQVLRDLLLGVSKYNFEIYCLILRKDRTFQIDNSASVYNYMLARLLNLIKQKDLRVLVDGSFGQEHQRKIRTFLRTALKYPLRNFKYGNSKSYNGLQLADIISGIIHRRYSEKRDDLNLFQLIKDKIKLVDEIK